MKVQINSIKTRTLVPITVQIKESQTEPTIHVKPLDEESLVHEFDVEVQKNPLGYYGEFWLERPGHYNINVTNQIQHFSQNIIVEKQEFLTFQMEFGFFFVTLLIAGLGVFLWMKKGKKT